MPLTLLRANSNDNIKCRMGLSGPACAGPPWKDAEHRQTRDGGKAEEDKE